MTDYIYKTINTACFHLPDGMYTIDELEELLEKFKQARKIQNEYLEKAIQPLSEGK